MLAAIQVLVSKKISNKRDGGFFEQNGRWNTAKLNGAYRDNVRTYGMLIEKLPYLLLVTSKA